MLDGKPMPVVALQVSDAGNAKTGFARLAKCAELEGDDFGWTLADDYIVISDSTEHAKAIVAAGKKSPLSEDADFQKWTDEAGGAGIVNAYVGRKAVDVALRGAELGTRRAELELGGEELLGVAMTRQQLADALAAYKDFQGAAAVLHFADGGIELSFAGGGGKAAQGSETVGDHVGCDARPTPRLLLAFAVPPGAFDAIDEGRPRRDRARSSSAACSASTSPRTSRPCSASPSASASAVTLRTTSPRSTSPVTSRWAR